MSYRPDRLRKVVTAAVAKKAPKVHRQIEALKLMLRALNLEFVEEHRFHTTRLWRFDLAVPSLKLAIEYQGHGQTGGKAHVGGHGSVTGLAKDCEKDFAALLLGWRVLKFTALHFTPATRTELKLTAPLDAIREMAGLIQNACQHPTAEAE